MKAFLNQKIKIVRLCAPFSPKLYLTHDLKYWLLDILKLTFQRKLLEQQVELNR